MRPEIKKWNWELKLKIEIELELRIIGGWEFEKRIGIWIENIGKFSTWFQTRVVLRSDIENWNWDMKLRSKI